MPEETTAKQLFTRWATGALAACIAETCTFPLDFTKTRLQLQNELGKSLTGEAAAGKGMGMLKTAAHIYRTEGLLSMYSGVGAATLRQAVYGGIGVGLYAPMRKLIIGDIDPKDAPLWKRIAAGAMTGAIGQTIASPTDVVKVRLQADGRLRAVGGTPRYKGTIDAFVRIPREEGVKGFFKGLGPSVQRAAIINGCGIASYDHTKSLVLKLTGASEGLASQVAGSLVSGLISAMVSTPFDVVKTRLMNQPVGSSLYSGPLDCAIKTARSEGLMALYKGFTPAYTRLAPWQVISFVALEKINKLAGLGQL